MRPATRLALKLEPLVAAKAKANQIATLKKGKSVPQNSAKREKPIDTRKELAKVAGLSHDTITKAKLIAEHANGKRTDLVSSCNQVATLADLGISTPEARFHHATLPTLASWTMLGVCETREALLRHVRHVAL